MRASPTAQCDPLKWADAEVHDMDRAEANGGFCEQNINITVADHVSALADNRGFAKVVQFDQCPLQNIADDRGRCSPRRTKYISNVADAPQAGRSAEFAQEDGSGGESPSDDEYHECETAGSATENDFANGHVTAVATVLVGNRGHVTAVATASARRNTKTEVGNVVLMVCNWGERSNKKGVCQNREAHDRQVMGSPAQILVLFEATTAVATMLEQQPQHVYDRPQSWRTGPAPAGNVALRDWHEHRVIIGGCAKNPVLMAARKNNCQGMECLYCESWFDGTFRLKGKTQVATTKVMVCAFEWKQNLGYLGKQVNVMGVHGHYHTMKLQFFNTFHA